MRRAARNSASSFRAGFDARMAGKSPSDCPYRWRADSPVPDAERVEWLAGWDAASEMLDKKDTTAADQQLAREGKKG